MIFNRLKYFIKRTFFIGLILLSSSAFSQTYNLVNYATDLGGNCYQLTDAVNNQNGAIWYSDMVDISQPFEINFMAYFGTQDIGADGIVFVLQTAGNNVMGGLGQEMGFGGFSPSLGIEFDIFENTNIGSPNEISTDHISIDINGDVTNVIAGPVDAIPPPNIWSSAGNIEDGNDYPVKIVWDPNNNNLLEVWFNCELRLSTNYDMLNNVFGGNNMVYYGYTASTGGLNNLQRICIDDNIFTVQDTVYICQGDSAQLDVTGSPSHTYTWSPATNIDDIHSQTPTVWPSVNTTYTVTYDDYCGNQQTDDVVVLISPAPQPDLGPDAQICQGDNITLDAGTWDSYLWSSGGTSQTETFTGSGTYSVTVTNANGCEGDDDVIVTEYAPPTVSAGSDASICTGGSTTLTATGTGSFVWSTTETTTSITVSPVVNTTYTVTITDANNCTNTDDVIVTIGSALTPSITNDTTICSGESVTLTAGGGTTYSWDTGGNSSSIAVNPSSTTTYNVTVTDGGTCTGTASVTVTVDSTPIVDAGVDQDICDGGSLTLTANGATMYLWSTNETTASINITPVSSGYYYVTGTNTGTCFAVDSVYITVNPLPVVDAGNDATICTGGSATLTATGTGSFEWSTTETTQSITVSPTTNTTYTVTLTDANNCTATDNVVVNVGSSIIASAGNDTTICDGASVTLTANGGTTYLWSTGDVTQSITVNPTIHTNYSVTVTDGTSCSGIDDVNVDINPLPIIDAGISQSVCAGDNVNLNATGGISYVWSNGSTMQSISFSPTASQYYYVTGTDVNSCSADDSVLVNVNPIPVVNLGNDISVCQGSAVNLSVSNTGTYLWSTGETTQSITVSPMTNQTITIVVTDANNCSSSDDINIDVSGSINISTSADTIACIGNTVNLSANGGVSYSWSTGANTASTSVVVTSSNTYYYVTVSDGGSCSGVDSILVSYYSNPNVDAGNSITICDGDNVVLTATGASQYVWDNGTTNASNSVNPSSTTTYTVTGTDQNACSASDNVTVSVAGDISLTIMHSPEIVCPGEQVILTTNISGGTPPYTLTLDDGTLISPPLILIPEQNTVVIINATSSSCNSTVTASDTIRVYDVPTPMFTSSVTNGCVPLVVDFNTSNAETGLTYNWDFGNFGNNFSNVKNPTQVYYQDGVFDVTLSLTTQEGCKSSTTINNMITVYPKPDAKFYADPIVVNILDPTVDFYNISTDNYINYWSFGDGDSSLLINPSHKFNPNTLGDFLVSLVAVSEYGCKDTAQSYIKVEDIATLYVPTAFSPDNDGINDIFKVSAYGIDTDNFDFIIYDRWGEKIFETKDLFTGWDGTYNMKLVESGVYSYIIIYKDFTGVEYTKSGILTLIR